ncbi:MAG: HAD family hydrolase [Lachnospiraceae bacterium]|nr:HAD family hydrolase [Lachnospiraceae bacterium]
MESLRNKPVTELLKRAKKLRKDPGSSLAGSKGKKLKVALLSSYSIQHFALILNLFLDNAGISAEIFEGEYGGINMAVLDEGSELYSFKPDIVLLLMRYTDIQYSENCVKETVDYLKNLWTHLDAINGVTILQSNFALPLTRPFGQLEAAYGNSYLSSMRRINLELTECHPSNVHIVDMEYLSSFVGKERWFDEGSYFLTKQGFAMDWFGLAADDITRMLYALTVHTNKCLVLDLDNTLWGGVVGDDGALGINVDPNEALGEAYRAFQNYVLMLKNRGVILAVNSKNDEEVAKEPFLKNPDMLLKLDDIACFVANWEDKASNMKRIADALNIGIDSLVFFDDNPAEREIIRQFCPEVTVIDVPEEPEKYIRALDEAAPFEWAEITEEDRKRADSYSANNKREALQSSFVDYNEYLKALEMEGECGFVGDAEKDRFAQLINKSNQFNLRTMRYTGAEIAELMNDDNTRCIYVTLKDKFTGYGIISCIILKLVQDSEISDEKVCFIDTWCMSCRVLKRGVEDMALKFVVETAREMGAKLLAGEYIPSAKNSMVKDLLKDFGFTRLDNKDRQLYTYELKHDPDKQFYIKGGHYEK